MKPKRPDSAKSAKTRITVDSEVSSNHITQSRLSETHSNGVKANGSRNNDFEKYVAEKNKDPKFKKFLEPTMPEIPEQLKPSAQLTKLTSKPFEKKTSKIDKEKIEKKVEEPPQSDQKEAKIVKKQSLQNSKTFMDKSKQKLKIPSRQEIQDNSHTGKIQQRNQNIEHEAKPKPKINLNGFVLNVPGKAPQVIKQQKVQQKVQETKQQKQKAERDRMMTQISDYVQQMESKNAEFMPKRYDQFIDRNFRNQDMSIEMINIDDFLEEPTEKDYDNLMKKINQNEQKLQSNDKPTSRISNNSSINLQQIIDGSQAKKQEQYEQNDDISVIMSSMSASDARDRNMFLTEILKGKRITQESLIQMKQNNDTMVKLIKLEGLNKEDDLDDSDVEVTEINMSKKKSNRIMERNKLEAAGDLYRECDFLTPEQRQRIEDIIGGTPIESPFQMTEMQRFMSRRIDEGIKLHRQLCQSAEGETQPQADIVIDESTLPKDPILRKKAELKILREKVNAINSRLANVNNITINKNKVQGLINKYKQVIKPSKMSESIINEKRKQIQSQCEKLQEAETILSKAENEKQEILRTLQQLTARFGDMQTDVSRMLNMDVEEMRKMEQGNLNEKKRRIKEVEDDLKGFEADINGIIEAGEEIKRKMEVLDQIMTVNSDAIKCDGYQEGQTIEGLDALITRRWQEAEEAVRMSRNNEQ